MIVDNALYHDGVRVPLDDGRPEPGPRPGPVRPRRLPVGRHPRPDPRRSCSRSPTTFDLHPLAVEDAGDSHQRPKVERYGDTLFLVLKTLWYVDEHDAVETGEINLFVGPRLRGDRPPRRGHRPGHLAARPRAARPGARARPDGGHVRHLRPRGRRVREGRRRAGGSTSTRSRSPSSPPPAPTTRCGSTSLKREIAEVRRAVMPLREPMRRFALAEVDGHRRGDRHLLPRRVRPPAAGLGGHRQPRQPAVDGLRRPPRADLGAAERGHAQDLRRRRAGRRAHPHRRGLRHELRPHARAALDLRLPLRARADGRRRPRCCSWFFKRSGWL